MEVFNDADALNDDLEVLEIIQHGFPRKIYERAEYFNTLDQCFSTCGSRPPGGSQSLYRGVAGGREDLIK